MYLKFYSLGNNSKSLKVICITLSRLGLTWEQRGSQRSNGKVVFVLRIFWGGWLVYVAFQLDCDQRGINSKSGPRSFYLLLLLAPRDTLLHQKPIRCSLNGKALPMKASNLRRAASTVQQHSCRLCLVHASVLLFSTTQCLCYLYAT